MPRARVGVRARARPTYVHAPRATCAPRVLWERVAKHGNVPARATHLSPAGASLRARFFSGETGGRVSLATRDASALLDTAPRLLTLATLPLL